MKLDDEYGTHAPVIDAAATAVGLRGVLVVWYSRGGRTAQVGEELARALHADREPIRELKPREGPGSRLRARWEGLVKRPEPLRPMRLRPADYGLVVVGTPVSYGQPAAPIRRYLADHARDFRRVAFFGVARNARAADSAFDEMQSLCGGQPAPRLWCPLGTYGGGDPIEGLHEFMHALRHGSARPSAAPLQEPCG